MTSQMMVLMLTLFAFSTEYGATYQLFDYNYSPKPVTPRTDPQHAWPWCLWRNVMYQSWRGCQDNTNNFSGNIFSNSIIKKTNRHNEILLDRLFDATQNIAVNNQYRETKPSIPYVYRILPKMSYFNMLPFRGKASRSNKRNRLSKEQTRKSFLSSFSPSYNLFKISNADTDPMKKYNIPLFPEYLFGKRKPSKVEVTKNPFSFNLKSTTVSSSIKTVSNLTPYATTTEMIPIINGNKTIRITPAISTPSVKSIVISDNDEDFGDKKQALKNHFQNLFLTSEGISTEGSGLIPVTNVSKIMCGDLVADSCRNTYFGDKEQFEALSVTTPKSAPVTNTVKYYPSKLNTVQLKYETMLKDNNVETFTGGRRKFSEEVVKITRTDTNFSTTSPLAQATTSFATEETVSLPNITLKQNSATVTDEGVASMTTNQEDLNEKKRKQLFDTFSVALDKFERKFYAVSVFLHNTFFISTYLISQDKNSERSLVFL